MAVARLHLVTIDNCDIAVLLVMLVIWLGWGLCRRANLLGSPG